MNILIAGASGLIGTSLTRHLSAQGHRVIPLRRNETGAPNTWWPAQQRIDLAEEEPLDVVINLAGPGVADRRWSVQRKQEIVEARVDATTLLSRTLAARPQQPRLFLSASAIGFYGPRNDEVLDESAPGGAGFLAEVSRRWEAATAAADAAGIRVVHARFGIVLDPAGGALKRMLPPFRWGLGGPLGSGRQFMSWIAMADLLRAVDFVIDREDLSGAVNFVAPGAVTNREFTQDLAKVLNRPAWIPMPAFQARLLFGELADEVLLTGARIAPGRLLQAGFEFQTPRLDQALRAVLGEVTR